MLPEEIKKEIIEIRNLFNNYEYMNKNKTELENIENNINKIIKDLSFYNNEAIHELILVHKAQPKIKQPLLTVKNVQDTGQFYENCAIVKKQFQQFLIKAKKRIQTLEQDFKDFSNNEKFAFYQEIKKYIIDNNIELLENLLNENLIDLNYVSYFNNNGQNANIPLIIFACEGNNLEIVKILCNNNANINVNVESNLTIDAVPLMVACTNYKYDIKLIKYLLDKGANVNIFNNNRNSPLHYLIKNFFPDEIEDIKKIIDLFLKQGFNINFQNSEGNTILHQAVLRESPLDIIKYLLDKGANVNSTNILGDTSLHTLIDRWNINCSILLRAKTSDTDLFKELVAVNKIIIDLFIANNLNINTQNILGNTILHKSIMYFGNKDNEISKHLLNKGALFNLKNSNNKTFLDLAKEFENAEILNFIANIK